MAKRGVSSRFVVDLGGLDLKPEDQRGLNAAIQGAVLSYLARYHPVPLERIRLLGNGIAGMIVDPAMGRRVR